MSRGKGSEQLKAALYGMEEGETVEFLNCTRNKLESAARILCREQIMSEIMSFDVFEEGGKLFARRGANL